MSLVCDLRTFKYSLLWEFRNNDTFPRDCLQQLYNLMPGKDQPHVRVQLTESSQCHCTMSILLLCYCLQAHSTSKVTIWCGRVFMPRPCSLFQQKTWHQTAAPGVVWDRHTNNPVVFCLGHHHGLSVNVLPQAHGLEHLLNSYLAALFWMIGERSVGGAYLEEMNHSVLVKPQGLYIAAWFQPECYIFLICWDASKQSHTPEFTNRSWVLLPSLPGWTVSLQTRILNKYWFPPHFLSGVWSQLWQKVTITIMYTVHWLMCCCSWALIRKNKIL